mgnify:CR=1 FL=1
MSRPQDLLAQPLTLPCGQVLKNRLAKSAMSEALLPLAIRLAAGATVLLMTAAISLWQPAGRSLEDWAFVLLRYISIPRVVVWRVRTSREVVAEAEARFEVLLPDRPDPHSGSAHR